jgi:hypothetical protein
MLNALGDTFGLSLWRQFRKSVLDWGRVTGRGIAGNMRLFAAYAVGQALKCPVGLERKAKEAKAFYSMALSSRKSVNYSWGPLQPPRLP